MKRLYIALLISLMLVGCQKVTDDTFIVGFTDYPPMGFRDTNGVAVGFDIDLATEVFKRLNMKVSFQYINWDSKTLELNSKNIDAIWNGFTITPSRQEEFLFTDPYLDNAVVILTRKEDTEIQSFDDLINKHISVESESSGQHLLESLLDVKKDIVLNRFTSIGEALLDLKAGNSDAIVTDEIYARYTLQDTNSYRIVENVRLNSEQYAVGLRKDDSELRDQINTVLTALKDDGTLSAISIKWFGEDLTKR